jgi:hypothetical protein
LRFSRDRGIVIKKVMLDEKKAGEITGGRDIIYQPRYGQITLKIFNKNIDLNLVMRQLSDIISAM